MSALIGGTAALAGCSREALDEGSDEEFASTQIARACVRGRGYRKTFLNPDRLKYPMKRVGKKGDGEFERISWEEAVDTIASEMTRIKEEYGPESRYVHYATGNSGMLSGGNLAMRLLALDGGYLNYHNPRISSNFIYLRKSNTR